MTRILVAVLLCAASSVGCSALNGNIGQGSLPSRLSMSQSAPRPAIQRAAYNQPTVGINSCECMQGDGCMCGCCDGVVDDCVSRVLDCPGCGDGCFSGNCHGGCYGGDCYGGGGACTCGHTGRCACCAKLKHMLSANCCCGGTGQCPCCQHLRTMIGGPHAGGTDAIYNFNPGPSSAQVAYPYYTTRGPRDFFLDNPSSIGPY